MNKTKNQNCKKNLFTQTFGIDLNCSNLSKRSDKLKSKVKQSKNEQESSPSLLKKSKHHKSLDKSHSKQKKPNFKNSRHKTSLSEESTGGKKIDIQSYNNKVRKNNKKFLSRENSTQNLNMRLPWGVNEPRLNNYVLQTLAKMKKIRKNQNQQKQHTFNTQRSQILKQSEVKYQQLTPKRLIPDQRKCLSKKKIAKSPIQQQKTQKTNKKESSKSNLNVSQQKLTEKQQRKSQSTSQEAQKQKIKKIPNLISTSFNGQFQCLQKNNLYIVNYRIVKKKIIQIEIAILKKIQSLSVNLLKGSLQCQSINQCYQNVMSKSSLILMSAVTGIKKHEKFTYPQLHIILNQKNGTFGFQKKIVIPYNWIYLIDILQTSQLKDIKFASKIKNKSTIEDIPYKKQILIKLDKIFQNNFVRLSSKNKDQIVFIFGFVYLGEPSLLKLIINGSLCSIQSECNPGGHAEEVLQMFANILDI